MEIEFVTIQQGPQEVLLLGGHTNGVYPSVDTKVFMIYG